MSAKKDNLPTNVDVDLENGGTIKYANEVIAIIAGVAASEIDGIAGMCTSGGISDIIGRNRNITRGVKVEVGGEEASVELYIIVEYGSPIQKVASDVQENVRKAIETMTGLHVVNVDVHVQGVSFEREKKAVQSGLEGIDALLVMIDGAACGPQDRQIVERMAQMKVPKALVVNKVDLMTPQTLAPLLAFLILHEAIPGNMLAGIACILCGSLASILPGLLAQRRAVPAAACEQEPER